MGSLAASGIPVPAKTPHTYRKYDRTLIKSTDNEDDTITTIVAQSLENRAIGSGSIVRDNNMDPATVEYYEELVWGLYQGGRSTTARIASDSGNTRTLDVDRAFPPLVVLPSGSGLPRSHHTGDRIVLNDPTSDTILERLPSSGAFD